MCFTYIIIYFKEKAAGLTVKRLCVDLKDKTAYVTWTRPHSESISKEWYCMILKTRAVLASKAPNCLQNSPFLCRLMFFASRRSNTPATTHNSLHENTVQSALTTVPVPVIKIWNERIVFWNPVSWGFYLTWDGLKHQQPQQSKSHSSMEDIFRAFYMICITGSKSC